MLVLDMFQADLRQNPGAGIATSREYIRAYWLIGNIWVQIKSIFLDSEATCCFSLQICLPFIALGSLRIMLCPYGTFAWKSKRCPLCLGFQLPSPFHQAYLCWIQLANHVLRPWPLQMPTWTFVPLPCLTLSHSSHPGLHLSVCPACDYSNPQILFYPNTKHLPPRDQALTKNWR